MSDPALEPPTHRGWLVVLAEERGLRWVLSEARMAFTKSRCARAMKIGAGDRVVFYATRGTYGNPKASQLIALATARSPLAAAEPPINIGGREFSCVFDLDFDVLLPEGNGIEAIPLIRGLSFIGHATNVGQYLQLSPLPLGMQDLDILTAALRSSAE